MEVGGQGRGEARGGQTRAHTDPLTIDPMKKSTTDSNNPHKLSILPAQDTKHLPLLQYPFKNHIFQLSQSNDGASNGSALWLGGQVLTAYLANVLPPLPPALLLVIPVGNALYCFVVAHILTLSSFFEITLRREALIWYSRLLQHIQVRPPKRAIRSMKVSKLVQTIPADLAQ
jgi:hypothetical protein